jgi:3-oxoacyl-[acyl-carrier protein] reductase
VDLRLDGKCALVTGSSAGIGAAIAEALAREGASVVVHGRDGERARIVVERIGQQGQTAKYVIGDLRSDDSAPEVFKKAESCFGTVDILVNNAGTYAERSWFETTAETWQEFYEADVLSAVRLILAAVR